MRKDIEFSIGALLFGCALAACSGGGSSPLPAGQNGGRTTPQQHTNAAFTISIPASSATRSTQYVSASTKSVSIAETDGSAAANSPVVQNTTPGSPNCTTSSGATSCTITVDANVGSDTFLVKTYDGTGATGNLLSSGTVSGTVVAGKANSFPLTLTGDVASFALVAADAYPRVGGSTTITAQAKDADGNTIIGSYNTPISIASGSTAATLSAAQLGSSSQSATLTLGGSATASFSVTGSGAGTSASLKVYPSSGIAYYDVGSGQYDAAGFLITAGRDGKLYYTTLGLTQCTGGFCYSSSGALGQFDPSTDTHTEIPLPQYEAVSVYQTADNALWISLAETNGSTHAVDGYVGHLSGAFSSSNLNVIALPTASPDPGNSRPRSFALGADGNLYLTGNTDHQIYKIPASNPSTSSITAIPLPIYTAPPTGPYPGTSEPPHPQGIAAGPDGKLYIANLSPDTSNVVQYDPVAGTFAAFALPQSPSSMEARYIVTGSDGNLYQSAAGTCLSMPCGGALNVLTTAGAVTAIPLSDAASWPDNIAAGSGKIAFADLGIGGVGTYDISSKELRDYPIMLPNAPCCTVAAFPQGVTVASDGSVWFITYGQVSSGGPLAIAHVVMTSNWSVWPSQNLSLIGAGTGAQQLIGIMESGDSSPFTTTTSNANVAQLEPIAGESHDFHLVGAGPGTCTVTITDKNGRSESIAVDVTTTRGTVQIKHPKGSI